MIFALVMVSFAVEKLFNLLQSPLSIFTFVAKILVFVGKLKAYIGNPKLTCICKSYLKQ